MSGAELTNEMYAGLGKLCRNVTVLARELDLARRELRVDGELLLDVITAACPLWLPEEMRREAAHRAVEELDRIGPGVRVFRGHIDRPWQPSARVAPEVLYDGVVDGCRLATDPGATPAPVADAEVRWAVFARPGGISWHVTDAGSETEAEAIARDTPGAWVARRVVITQKVGAVT